MTSTPAATAPASAPGETKNATEAQAADAWAAGVAQVRSAAAWIVKAFAAIAVALVGTSPLLVHLGDLGLNARSVIAVLGAVAALTAIGLIINWATDVNLTQVTDIIDLSAQPPDPVTDELLTHIAGSPGGRQLYLGGRNNVQELLDDRSRTVAAYDHNVKAYGSMKTQVGQAAVDAQIDASVDTLARIDAIIDNLQGWVTYRKIRRRFDDRRMPMFVAGAVAVVGIALWLIALGIDVSGSKSTAAPAGTPGTVAASQGTVGTLTWSTDRATKPAVTALRGQLGLEAAACDRATVIVAGGAGDPIDPWQVTVLPNQACAVPANLSSFTVDRRVATFGGLTTATAPSATVTIKASGSSLATGGWVILLVLAVAVAGLVGFFARPILKWLADVLGISGP